MGNFAGSEATATAWYDGSSDNFWVFHGCDGAGLQMGDCGGGTYYIEQFGPSSGASPPFAWPPAHSDSDYSTSHQRPEAFMHPGSFRKYQWYNAGMWTNCYASQWPDESRIGGGRWVFLTLRTWALTPRTRL